MNVLVKRYPQFWGYLPQKFGVPLILGVSLNPSIVERSLSAEALHRITLPDDAWLVEKTGDRELIEKQKAFHELEMVKQARLETLEVIENMELERPSSR